jgi:hypothetical protein
MKEIFLAVILGPQVIFWAFMAFRAFLSKRQLNPSQPTPLALGIITPILPSPHAPPPCVACRKIQKLILLSSKIVEYEIERVRLLESEVLDMASLDFLTRQVKTLELERHKLRLDIDIQL